MGLEASVRPDLSNNAFPEYPSVAVAQRLEGTVLLRLRIDATGKVQRVEIASSSGHRLLDDAAVKAVRTWKGTPGQRGNRPVTTEELLPIRFRL
jgi:protein TonB